MTDSPEVAFLKGEQAKLPQRPPRPVPDHFDGWLAGERYNYDPDKPNIRAGAGATHVLEIAGAQWGDDISLPDPIAGPVYRKMQPDGYTAHCVGCDAHSKLYKRRGERSMWNWAHHHRCGVLSQQEMQALLRATRSPHSRRAEP